MVESNYSEDYFRDVVFVLSKRVDGRILMDSTMVDVEYYLKKLQEERETQNDSMRLD